MRDENGHWLPGYSGNPSGRPAVPEDVREALKEHTHKAVQVLAAGMEDEDPRVRIVCAKEILDRAYGKPAITKIDEGQTESVQEIHLAVLKEMSQKANHGSGKQAGHSRIPSK